MSFVESHLLTLVIFLPVLGAVLIALLPRGEGGQHKGIAFLFSLLTFLISIPLWTGFRAGPGRYAFEQKTEWRPPSASATTSGSTAWRSCSSCSPPSSARWWCSAPG